jgi:hypothetical protein
VREKEASHMKLDQMFGHVVGDGMDGTNARSIGSGRAAPDGCGLALMLLMLE